MARVPASLVLKPRSASVRHRHEENHTPTNSGPGSIGLGDDQSSYLLDTIYSGQVFHVDSVVSERQVYSEGMLWRDRPRRPLSPRMEAFHDAHTPREAGETGHFTTSTETCCRSSVSSRVITTNPERPQPQEKIYFWKSPRARWRRLHLLTSRGCDMASILARDWAKLAKSVWGKTPYECAAAATRLRGVVICPGAAGDPDNRRTVDRDRLSRDEYHHAGFT